MQPLVFKVKITHPFGFNVGDVCTLYINNIQPQPDDTLGVNTQLVKTLTDGSITEGRERTMPGSLAGIIVSFDLQTGGPKVNLTALDVVLGQLGVERIEDNQE